MILPLTLSRVATAWTLRPAVVLGVVVLAVGYAAGLRAVRRRGARWSAARTTAWVAGVVLLAVIGSSFVAVYDDVLFWARAVQGVVLLVAAPMLLAAGAPLTLVQSTAPVGVRRLLGRVRRGRAARTVTSPGVVTVLLLAPPFVIYLTGLYPAMLDSGAVSGTVSVGLLVCGFVYAASRLQIDPMPRRTHHGLTLVIALAEILADGVLGLVLWFGPLLAADHYLALGRAWGPAPRTDQVIGAGVWWIGGDVAGLPFLLAIMSRFAAADDARAAELDAELDAEESPEPRETQAGEPVGSAAEDPADEADAARRRALWWQDDPYLAERFRRR